MAVSATISPGIRIRISVDPPPPDAFKVVPVKERFVHSVISSIAPVAAVPLQRSLAVAIVIPFVVTAHALTMFTPSIATTPALTLDIVASEACQSSMLPTHIAVDVEATRPAIGNHVQFVSVHDDGVPSA